ncbi:MAG: hypothetical protein KME26_05825 [Oscillatoria princeps RMCB-10]|nr:hypothetical protein [Oscillatoria princeps RMCB-10]
MKLISQNEGAGRFNENAGVTLSCGSLPSNRPKARGTPHRHATCEATVPVLQGC